MKNQIKDLRFMKTLANSQLIWGSFFLTFGVVSFLGFLYCAVISKFLPPSQNPLIFAIQRDRYYCFLVPLSLPILVVAVYFHWLSMKLFKHASFLHQSSSVSCRLISFLSVTTLQAIFRFGS